jgi:hypothetical protein
VKPTTDSKVYGIVVHQTKIWSYVVYVAYNPKSKIYHAFVAGNWLPAVKGNSVEDAVMRYTATYVY